MTSINDQKNDSESDEYARFLHPEQVKELKQKLIKQFSVYPRDVKLKLWKKSELGIHSVLANPFGRQLQPQIHIPFNDRGYGYGCHYSNDEDIKDHIKFTSLGPVILHLVEHEHSGHYLLYIQDSDLHCIINQQARKIEQLEQKFRALTTELYQPDGKGAKRAKHHFESTAKRIKSLDDSDEDNDDNVKQ
jgi:hypothetical protein